MGKTHAVVHAYGAGNEDYEQWRQFKTKSANETETAFDGGENENMDGGEKGREKGGEKGGETNVKNGGGTARGRGYNEALVGGYEMKKEADALFLWESAGG